MTENRENSVPLDGNQGEKPLDASIQRFILRRVRSVHIAEELTQEAFLRLAAQIPPIAAAQVRAWLYRTARNLIADAFRRKKVTRRAMAEIEYLRGGRTLPDSRQELERKEENDMMIEMVNRLDDAHREVVRLKFQEGLTYQEIAQVVDKPKTTVAWLLHESLLRLRDEMKVTK